MKEFGSALKSSPIVELTEAETEYVVKVVKHIFKEHIVLQYDITNTLDSVVLENVSVLATPSDEEELEEVFIIEAEKLPQNVPGKVYVAFKKAGGDGALPISTFSNTLKFTSKEIDPTTNEPEDTGYDDEYEVAEFDLAGSDYVIPTYASNFAHLWEQVGASGEEAEETLVLSSMKGIAGKSDNATPFSPDNPSMIYTDSDIHYRGNRTARQDTLPPATRGYRCAHQPDDAHAQVARQVSQRRQGCGKCSDGLLIQIWCHDQDYRTRGGGGRGCACRGIYCVIEACIVNCVGADG